MIGAQFLFGGNGAGLKGSADAQEATVQPNGVFYRPGHDPP